VKCFLGIDIGTTHTKAVIINHNGQLLFETKKGYDLLHPQPGYEEQDPVLIMDAVATVIKKALLSVPPGDEVAGVGFSAAMHSLLPVDATGEPLYNAIIWADTRSRKEAEEIARHPEADKIVESTGIPIHPMSPLCKIVWFKKQLPEVFRKTCRFISIKEYVFFCLFGKYIVDYSVASATGLFNIKDRKWESAALKLAGIEEGKLSESVSTLHIETALLPEYAKLFNIRKAIPFVIGSSDGCLANLGSGAVQQGEMALTIGTSGAVRMTVNAGPDTAIKDRLFIYPLTDELYVSGGAINNGGIVLKWLSEFFFNGEQEKEEDYATLLSLAEDVGPGSDGLFFLPYLLGERAPVWDANAKGVLVGLTMSHKKGHVVRAAMEGISFTLAQLVKKLERAYGTVNEISVSGGFVQSPFWVQLIAHITGKRIKVTEMADASALGAACLGMYATGHLNDLIEVKQFVKVTKMYEPDPSIHEKYRELSGFFDSIYPRLKDDFAILNRLKEK
jgi:gluconokinase